MFVVWQKLKPRIITDHAGSGLNDGISKEDSKVRYDDMHPFGQAMRQARRDNPAVDLVLYKMSRQLFLTFWHIPCGSSDKL